MNYWIYSESESVMWADISCCKCLCETIVPLMEFSWTLFWKKLILIRFSYLIGADILLQVFSNCLSSSWRKVSTSPMSVVYLYISCCRILFRFSLQPTLAFWIGCSLRFQMGWHIHTLLSTLLHSCTPSLSDLLSCHLVRLEFLGETMHGTQTYMYAHNTNTIRHTRYASPNTKALITPWPWFFQGGA